MSTSATSQIAFTGVSTYSSDLQSILTRAVSIAQLPVQVLQMQQSTNSQKVQMLGTLQSAVSALGTSVAALGKIGAGKGLDATSSDPTTVTVSNTGATAPTTYTISSITSTASAASETSTSGYADSSKTAVIDSGGSTLDLLVGSTHYTITLKTGENNLVGLRNEINASGAPVTASILTTGTGANPNYLSVTANSQGATTLQLNGTAPGASSATDLLTGSANAGRQGSDAVFSLNGIPVDRKTNTINDVIPGVTFTLAGQSSSPVTLSLSSDTTSLSGALSDLVTNYNALATQISQQTGKGGGVLGGDMMVRQAMDDMRQLTSYQGPGNMSLAALGVTFSDTTGQMTFNPTALNALSGTDLTNAFSFLGSSTTGLGAFASKFNQLSDPISGMIQTEAQGLTTENTTITNHINALNAQITTMQNNLTAQLEKADAAIASLQSMQNIITSSVQSVDLALYGQNFGSALA